MSIDLNELVEHMDKLQTEHIIDDPMFNLGYTQALIDVKFFCLSKKKVGSVHKETER